MLISALRSSIFHYPPILRSITRSSLVHNALDRHTIQHGLEEALHDHALGLGPAETTGHQIEDILVLDLGRGGGMGAAHIVGLDLKAGNAVGAGSAVQNQIAVALEGVGLLRIVAEP